MINNDLKIKLKLSNVKGLKLLLAATLLIDYLNGMLIGWHIGEFFRILLIVLCFSILYKDRTKLIKCLFIYLFLVFNIICSIVVWNHDIMAFIYDMSMAFKVSLVFLLTTTLVLLFKQKRIGINFIDDILKINLMYGPGLFIVTRALGVGRGSYLWNDSFLGFKSLFLSLNSINIALIVLYIFAVSHMYTDKNPLRWGIYSVYVIFPLLMLGTKTGLVMIIAVPLILFYINAKQKRTWIICASVLITLLFLLPLVGDVVYKNLSAIIERQDYLFEQRDVVTYIFSTRNLRLIRSLEYYWETLSVLDFFPGRGYYAFHSIIGQWEGAKVIPIEMDWADIFTSYGIVGFLFTYVYSLCILFRKKVIMQVRIIQVYFLSSLFVFLFGTFGGHLYFEAISSTFFSLVCSGIVICTTGNNILEKNYE